MSSNTVQKLWKKHWKTQATIEESGSFYGKLLHKKRLVILENMLRRFDTNSSVLDMGCGGGTTISTFKKAGFNNIVGIDFTEESMSRCEKLGLTYGKDVFLMDAKSTQFPDESFDIVFSEGLWEHFIDPRPHMAEACRLAKKYIIVIQPDHYSFFGWLMHIGWNIFAQNKGGVKEYSFLLSYFSDFLRMHHFKCIACKSTLFHEQVVMIFKKIVPYTYNINGVKVCMYHNKPYDKLQHFVSKNDQCDLVFNTITPLVSMDPNTIFARYKHKLSSWQMTLHNFNCHRTTVWFHGDRFFSRHLFFTMIFEPLVQYKHAHKNHLVLHAASVSNNGKSYAFSADAGVGKTTVLLHLLSSGCKYLADDQTVIDTASFTTLPYPLPIGINLQLALKTRLALSLKHKVKLVVQTFINVLFFNYTNLTTTVHLEHLKFGCTTARISEPAKLHKIFILEKSLTFSLTQLTEEQAFQALWKCKFGSKSKLPALIYYSEEFKKKNPSFELWSEYRALLLKLVHEIPVYKISFDKKHFPQLIKFIMNEIKGD